MKYTIITGEPSGDIHGANLIKAINKVDSQAQFSYTGGPAMEELNGTKILDIREMAFMGFVEVLINLINIYKIQRSIKKAIDEFRPDVIIFIDYPGLNLRLAKWAKSKGFKTAYYILPKAWAWNKSRTNQLKRYIDLNLSIFPFEVPFFKDHGLTIHYVGNPSMALLGHSYSAHNFSDKPVIALLPGSRVQEVKRMLPVMLEAVKGMDEFDVIVSRARNLPASLYPEGIEVSEDYIDLLKKAKYAIVTSGTATLEAALLDVPQIVVYKSSWLSMKIARKLVKLKYISLVNLVIDEPVVKELIQEEANARRIKMEFKMLMRDDAFKCKQLYQKIKNELGPKVASEEAAQLILNLAHS